MRISRGLLIFSLILGLARPALAQVDARFPNFDMNTPNLVRIGSSATACTAAIEGAIRYNDANNSVDLCDDDAWIQVGPGTSSVPISSMLDTTRAATLANQNFAQTWNWSTLTTETGLHMMGTFTQAGQVFQVVSESPNFTGELINITLTGDSPSNTGAVAKVNSTGALTTSIAMVVTNVGLGTTFRVNDETGDADPTPFLIDDAGNTGIGTPTPAMKVHVNGEMIIGNTGLACSGTTEGSMRYNTTSDCVELCNGTTWTCFEDAGCDDTPSAYDFPDLAGLTASTQYTSSIIGISGTDAACLVRISLNGSGNPEYRICDDSSCTGVSQTWTASNSDLDLTGKYIQLRATTDASPSTSRIIALDLGDAFNDWKLTTTSTGPCGDVGPGDEGTVCADGSVYAGINPNDNRNMYVTRCDVGQSWSGSACTGTRSTLAWNNGNTSGYVTTSASSSMGYHQSEALAAMDADNITAGTQPHQAAAACANLTDHGKSDWFLPSLAESLVIYKKLVDGTPEDSSPNPVISGFGTGIYWSSQERDINEGYYRRFSDGASFDTEKSLGYSVRCARKD